MEQFEERLLTCMHKERSNHSDYIKKKRFMNLINFIGRRFDVNKCYACSKLMNYSSFKFIRSFCAILYIVILSYAI